MSQSRSWDIRPPVLAVSVALSVLVCCSQASGQDVPPPQVDDEIEYYHPMVPCGLPYECVDFVGFRNANLAWRFSFDPARSAIYDIVTWTVLGPGKPREFVAQLAQYDDGSRRYLIWEKRYRRIWWRPWSRRAYWTELQVGSREHGEQITKLRNLFVLANRIRQGEDSKLLDY